MHHDAALGDCLAVWKIIHHDAPPCGHIMLGWPSEMGGGEGEEEEGEEEGKSWCLCV